MESKTANDLEVTESKSSVEDYIALLKTSGDVTAIFTVVWSLACAR